ncbi:hypothetical protein BAE44_0010482 [Dichanthelium oligosanthes]|uniref:Pentatricopeptide repeat-containing protein n=1 Tax=Dichanthelium oligosanthes TaxID=888268 RepID=A0A1E5VTV0_9POAL|nr:hypothetical protein BAE44_0010482 [Dichanthelium oligosanthes]
MYFVGNCLIDMYSKCGDVDTARNVFDGMPKRNEVSWTSMMSGYGMHGRGNEAMDIFENMQKAGFVPDDVSFLLPVQSIMLVLLTCWLALGD